MSMNPVREGKPLLKFGSPVCLLFIACTAANFDDQTESSDADEQTSTSTSDTQEDTDDGIEECTWQPEPGAGEIGTPCADNVECASGVCEVFQTFNAEGAGTCAETPSDCRTRIMASVRDLLTDEPVARATVRMVAAPDAVSGPDQATTILAAETDESGRVDTTSTTRLEAPYAILGLVEHADYAITGNGAGVPNAEGFYDPCLKERDWWAVAQADLDLWNESLSSDPMVAPFLPLENGVIVGVARRGEYPSTPIAGVSMVSEVPDSSSAVIRYLEPDGVSFNDVATTESGLFLMFGVATGERFAAHADGFAAAVPENLRAASFAQLAYIMKVWMVPQMGRGEP